jgi:hypothetical protein
LGRAGRNEPANVCRGLQRHTAAFAKPSNKFPVVDGLPTEGAGRHRVQIKEPLDLAQEGQCFAHAHLIMGVCPLSQWAKTQSIMGGMMGILPLMDSAVRRRFEAVVEASPFTHKAASLISGLGETFVRDVIKRDRGKLENVIKVVATIAPNYTDWVQTGRGSAPPSELPVASVLHGNRKVPVVGYAGAGGQAVFESLPGDDTIEADAPPGTVAVKIRGVSLGPGFDGWYALYSERRNPFTDDLYGRLCVVGTEDGRTLVKWVRRTSGPGVSLHSGVGEIEEPVPLAWAARVIDLRPS